MSRTNSVESLISPTGAGETKKNILFIPEDNSNFQAYLEKRRLCSFIGEINANNCVYSQE